MASIYSSKKSSTQGQRVQIGAMEMYYEEYGAGKPLLLLHGFGGCVQNWYPFIDELSKQHRLIVVDLRGHGFSTNPEMQFTHKQAAEDVFFLLEKLGIETFSAMGMSTGGMILLHMATSQVKRIESMVLISATTHFPNQARTIMRRASLSTLPQEVLEMYKECAKRGDEQIRELITQINALGDNYNDMNFTAESLSTITARTLIVHGDRDNFFPLEIAESIAQAIPNACLWMIEGGEHVPIFDSAVPFTSEAIDFLKNKSK